MRNIYPLLILLLSCSTEPEGIYGCTNIGASNYQVNATIDDGSCYVDLWGINYSLDATRVIDLNETGLTGIIPDELCLIYDNLDILNLSGNSLCPPYPPCLYHNQENSILRTVDAGNAILYIFDSTVKIIADGFIGGIQMTLSHGTDFNIELTDKAIVAEYSTNGNETTLIIVAPESDELLITNGEYEIVDMIVANSAGQMDVSVIHLDLGDQDLANCTDNCSSGVEGSNFVDDCGVCNGDNSTCTDNNNLINNYELEDLNINSTTSGQILEHSSFLGKAILYYFPSSDT